MRISVRGIEPGEIDALLHFSEQMYGKGSYQSRRAYFDWLYQANPASRGHGDCMVAMAGAEMVGCIHRMRLPCAADAGTATLASLQNHVIAPNLRGGAGIMLLQKAVKDESIAYSPGVHGRLADAYRRLGYYELPNFWLWRIVQPVRAAVQMALKAVSRGGDVSVNRKKIAGFDGTFLTVTTAPDAIQLERLAEGLNAQALRHQGARVLWTAELVGWRYFSTGGPLHLLVERPGDGAWGVLSYGAKSRVNVARLVEYEPGSARDFMNDVTRVARRIGAAVMMAYTMRVEYRDQLMAAGWRLRRDPPSSFAIGAERLSVSAAASDVGFEAFNAKVSG